MKKPQAKKKPKTNYYLQLHAQLLRDARKLCEELRTRHRVAMWVYPADTIKKNTWWLIDLRERVQAADQLGYEVHLEVDERGGLRVTYVKKVDIPDL